MARTIIFGDVHGCIDELQKLIDIANPQPGDRIVSAGDLVHKGPNDSAVVKLCRSRGVELCLGNHEQQQANFRKALAAVGGNVAKISVRDEAAKKERLATEQGLDAEDVAYLESGRLFIQVPGGIVVHGGILPELERIPSDEEIAALDKAAYSKLALCTRVRFLRGKPETKVQVEFTIPVDFGKDEDIDYVTLAATAHQTVLIKKVVKPVGGFIPLLEDGPDDYFWATKYDGRFGHVYFGHEAVKGDKPREWQHATCLDTACVQGASLSAVVIDNDTLEKHYIVVPAARRYSEWEGGDE